MVHSIVGLRLFLVLSFWVLFGVFASAQGLESGKLWMLNQIENGALLEEQQASTNTLALSYQSSKESIEALVALDDSTSLSTAKVLAPFDSTKESHTTLFLATEISSYALLGKAYPSSLLLLQNDDGGFGHSRGYESSVIDTAQALEALFVTKSNTAAISKAINYLVQTQSDDGTWQDTIGEKSYTTTLALRALWLHRKSYNVLDAMQKAKAYLLSLVRSDGSFSDEIFETALVLRSIAPFMYDKTVLQDTIDYLYSTQESSGAWANDVYTTALVLQALSLADKDVPNPDLAKLSGLVVDADTGVALSGMSISLTNETNITTQADGMFSFSGLKNGSYTLDVLSDNYAPLHSVVRLVGEDVDLGRLRLSRDVNATISVLKGTIKERKTAMPLQGIKVMLDSREVQTDSNGSYVLDSVEAGSHTIVVSKAGYIRKQQTINIPANTIMHYNLLLDSIDFTTEAKVTGRVIDGNTSTALTAVTVALRGAKESTLQTDANGTFHFSKLGAGEYKIVISKAGYRTVSTAFTVTHTGVIDYGDVVLEALSPSDTGVIVRGIVTDAVSNTPIAGVNIKAGTKQATTDSNGSYEIRDIPAGALHLEVTKEGYGTKVADANASEGAVLIFSPSLSSNDTTLSISGTVLDSNGSEPLGDVKVEYVGDTNITVMTDNKGYYVLSPVVSGDATLRYSKVGYEAVEFEVSVGESSLNVSPVLTAIDMTQADNNATLYGVVMDSITNEPLENVEINIDGNFTHKTIYSDINGSFMLDNILSYELNITFVKDEYKTVETMVVLQKDEHFDIAQVRMRPLSADVLLPDLAMKEINMSNIRIEQDKLDLSGSLSIEVTNKGTIATESGFSVLAFYDVDKDGNYSESVDTVLGKSTTEELLDIEDTITVAIDVKGTLPYVNAPIALWIDSGTKIVESDEENNMVSSSDRCIVVYTHEIGKFHPVVKFEWDWTNASYPN